MEIAEEASTTQIEYANGEDKTLTVSYMQSVTPFITLGGSGTYSLSTKSLQTAFGGMYKSPENLLALQWDDKVGSNKQKKKKTIRMMYLHSVALFVSDHNCCGYFSCKIKSIII